jgi:hypothetical protein
MDKYSEILKFTGFHIVISIISQLLCETFQIPGHIKLYLMIGIILLAVYLAALYYTVMKSEKHGLLLIEIWKLLIIGTCSAVLVSVNNVPLLTIVCLTPFRPLLLSSLKSGPYIIIAGLLFEGLIELKALRKRMCCPVSDSKHISENE